MRYNFFFSFGSGLKNSSKKKRGKRSNDIKLDFFFETSNEKKEFYFTFLDLLELVEIK